MSQEGDHDLGLHRHGLALLMVTLDNLVVTTALPVIKRITQRHHRAARVDRQRLHADVRGAAADGRRARRSLRAPPDVRHRREHLHGRLRGRCPGADHRDAHPGARAPGRGRRDRGAPDADHPLCEPCRPTAGAWRSAPGAPSAAWPSRSARWSVAPSPKASPGSGSSGSTCPSASSWSRSPGPA